MVRQDFAGIQNKKECGGNRQWQNTNDRFDFALKIISNGIHGLQGEWKNEAVFE
jgi:hypothetical protein